MTRIRIALSTAAAVLFAASTAIEGQQLTSIPAPAYWKDGPVIRAHAEPGKPFTVAGERGVLVGQQDGSLEAWVLPVKLLSHLEIEAEIEGYTVPIPLNREAAAIEVRADRTTITYSHIGFTVRQTMFAANEAEAGAGPVVLFDFDCLHPTRFTLRFTPDLKWMWPERSEGVPGVEWDKTAGGFYVLHGDYPDLAGAVALPGAQPGILAPYQERPQVHPVEFRLAIDPKRDQGRVFPLLMAVGTRAETATNAALARRLLDLNTGVAALYAQHAARWKKVVDESTRIETPDKALNEAFQWSAIAIEQMRARTLDKDELGLVAGYYASADSARPGFGWFFGRDSLYTIPAIDGYGDFALAKAELEFLIRRQRADGKIMHEYSQVAGRIDWLQFPYMYAAADSVPLFLLAVEDYVKASGDLEFLKANREAIEKAWTFETTHDTDGDGIYDNAQGTGWVESWPGGMPRQEIYLALLDEEASGAYAALETLLGDPAKAASAGKRAGQIGQTIEREYADTAKGCYAFSHNPDGSQDRTRTVYPALAWWRPGAELKRADECLRQLAGHALATDWGLRDVADDEPIYDGMSYHQGSVWPLFTGWAAMAEYRGGQPLAGYQLLMENANLTRAQDLGSQTELLSGDFYVPMGRSTSHQMWSSAMVITPALKGLFGISVDAEAKTVTVNPHLPGGWERAVVTNLALPGSKATLTFERSGDALRVNLDLPGAQAREWKVLSDLPGAKVGPGETRFPGVTIPLPPVEIAAQSPSAPVYGARTAEPRLVSEKWESNRATLVFEGPSGSKTSYAILRHRLLPKLHFESPENKGIANGDLDHLAEYVTFVDSAPRDAKAPMGLFLHFPDGEGWKTVTVTLSW